MKIFRRALLVLVAVCLATLLAVALGYAMENYRGGRRWTAVRRGLEARGESFDPSQFIPPMVPDDRNLAMAPFFARLYQYRVDPATGLLTFSHDGNTQAALTADTIPYGQKDSGIRPGVGWPGAQPLNLEKFRVYYRARSDFSHPSGPAFAAEEVLTALTRFQPLIDELKEAAATRPLARFPVNWTQKPAAKINLPHGYLIQNLVGLLRLQACAELAAGRSEAALSDIRLGFRLSGALAAEPNLIASLIEVTCEGMLLQPVWEGLQARCWNGNQLAELQACFSQGNLLASYRRCVQAERVWTTLPLLEDIKQGKEVSGLFLLSTSGETPPRHLLWINLLYHSFPGGWYDEAKPWRLTWNNATSLIPSRWKLTGWMCNASKKADGW